MVSVLEYGLACLAVANTVYQAYQLAYWTVTVSTIAIYMHAMGYLEIRLRYQASHAKTCEKGGLFWPRIRREATPCLYGEPHILAPRHHGVAQSRPPAAAYLLQALFFWKNIGVAVLFIYGTVILSSQIFISLGDAIPVMARFILGSIVYESHVTLLEVDYTIPKSNLTYFADLDVSRTHLVSHLLRPGLHLTTDNASTKLVMDPSGSSRPARGMLGIILGAVGCSFKREIKPSLLSSHDTSLPFLRRGRGTRRREKSSGN
ncbi:hypothetical protein DL767_002351 [Monosporascus sp. MG133]|nr:hypothetical protein DL767_002351 [Monosporascus sp. MG133]